MEPVSDILRSWLVDSELGAVLYVDEVIDGEGRFLQLDRSLSVSAMPESEAASRVLEEDTHGKEGRRLLTTEGEF